MTLLRSLFRRRGWPLRGTGFVLVTLMLAMAFPVWAATAADSAAAGLISAAGNAASESVRLAKLRELAQRGATLLDAPTRAELDSLLPVVSAWAEGRAQALEQLERGSGETHRYLHQFFNSPTLAWQPPFPAEPRRDSPVYPLWAFYRGRFLAWVMIENSDVSAVPARKAAFVGEAERCFAVARAAFPDNATLAIYAGKNQPSPGMSAWEDRAPAWANHQRGALEQLHRIIRWWIAERQLPNGEFGGKWGDDIEMWRWWSSILIGFDDPVVTAAQEKLARGNLARPGMAGGYTSQLTDVEHTAEETADTLTPLLHVTREDARWTPAVRRLIQLADQVWWGENERGKLQFKHIDFNHERVGADAARAYDTGYHVRVMQPPLLLWQRTGDPALGAPLTRWLRTWAEAALSSDNGKPAGIVPAALQWPSGLVGSRERGWIGPELKGDAMQGLYSWPGYPVAAMTVTLLQAHRQTGEAIFLEPLLRMAALRRAHLAAGNRDGAPGSEAWAAHRLPRIINDALAKWRQLYGDARFDDLLKADAGGYARYLLGDGEEPLTQALAATAGTLSVNWPMFTDEVRYTDRVLSVPHAWPRTVATGLARVDAALVYSTVTGDMGAVDHFPLNGVRWHTAPRDFAVLVAENRRDRLTANLFHFGAGQRAIAASLLMLEAGRYTWTLTQSDGRVLATGEHTITMDKRRIEFAVPAGVLCRLKVEKRG